MNTIDLEVQGMSCGACVKHVTQALQAVPGVDAVEVDLTAGRARVTADSTQSSLPMVAALEAAGYPARLATTSGPVGQPAATVPKSTACHGGKAGGCGCSGG